MPTQAEATRVFARIGLLSFGGPAAQIALMHRELVEDRPWLSEKEYLGALSFCMLLPGPEAMQLATYAGWKLHGIRGGLIAGLLFVLPGAAVVLALAIAYGLFGQVPLVQALFLGVKAAVVVIVIEALLKVSRRALKQRAHWIIAGLAFLGIFALHLPFPVIIALAGLWGFLTSRGDQSTPPPMQPVRTGSTILLWLAIWLVPLALLALLEGGILTQIGWFFAKLAVVTFGGAYAVLAYMTQAVVNDHGWLTTAAMMDGLGLAETTPGPLILVTEFVAYLAAFQAGGIGLGIAGAIIALWMTFVPCFLWIFAGAPYLGWISSRPRLTGALSAITAAVVGVILNLSLWFAAHVFFGEVGSAGFGPVRVIAPVVTTLDPVTVALALIAGWVILRRHWSLPAALALCAALGLAATLVPGGV
ncbi:chromate efflux transporter [Plastorhodobacter daqingensis]|uniref:Chromate efflux transporter n=1 Tax=Plastorhodobacter daqingensis TaxID=1387281 RepID=A0ABW2UHH0_9RHOB